MVEAEKPAAPAMAPIRPPLASGRPILPPIGTHATPARPLLRSPRPRWWRPDVPWRRRSPGRPRKLPPSPRPPRANTSRRRIRVLAPVKFFMDRALRFPPGLRKACGRARPRCRVRLCLGQPVQARLPRVLSPVSLSRGRCAAAARSCRETRRPAALDASAPVSPRPGAPKAPSSPVPGQPIYRGPIRPGQPIVTRQSPTGPRVQVVRVLPVDPCAPADRARNILPRADAWNQACRLRRWKRRADAPARSRAGVSLASVPRKRERFGRSAGMWRPGRRPSAARL